MSLKNCLFIFISLVISDYAYSCGIYLFIDSSNSCHVSLLENVNAVYSELNNANKKICVVDISPEGGTFAGDINYISDKSGVLVSKFMPSKIPELIVLGEEVKRRIYLDCGIYNHSELLSLIKEVTK